MTSQNKILLAGHPLKTALEAVCRDLVYVSETDSPVDVIFIAGDEHNNVEEDEFLMGLGSPRPDANSSAKEFFGRLTTNKEWHTEKDKRTVSRYRRLEKLIFENLADVRLVRRGRVKIEIFLFGRDAEGNIAGIRTNAVET